MAANLEISTVVGCKLSCDYCPQTAHVREFASKNSDADGFVMDSENFERYLRTVPSDVEIMFAGMAEPFLNPHAGYMILYAHNTGSPVSVYTTTVGIGPQLDRLAGIDFHHFCIHLPDADGLMHLNVDDEYLDGLRACMKAIPNHHFTLIGKLHPKVREVLGPIADTIKDDSPGLISRAGNVTALAKPPKEGKLRCSAVTGNVLDHNVLLPDGSVLICCCDYAQKHVIGNLMLGMKYEHLFKSEEYKRVMQGLESEPGTICRTCEYAVPV